MTAFPDIKPVYRVLLPILVGTLTYLAILLAFDTVDAMMEDFFSRELLFCIGVSGALLEANRGMLQLFKKKIIYSRESGKYTAILLSLSAALCIIMVSSLLIGYFWWFENMTEIAIYKTELKIFNGVFLFVTMLYQGHFLGFYLIQKRFERELEKETREKETLDRSVNLFHYKLNPRFLLTCLDTIILRLREKKFEQADEGLLLLSDIYRHSLKTQEELVYLRDEMEAMKSTATFLNQFISKHIDIRAQELDQDYVLVPRTLTKLLEAIASSQLSSSHAPLQITIETHKDHLILNFPCNFSLVSEDHLYDTLREMQQQYAWLGKQMKWVTNATFFIYIPLEKLFEQAAEKPKQSIYSIPPRQA
jgi:hypothetical protein